MASTVALRADNLAPRRGGGDLRQVLDDAWLRRVVTTAGAAVADPPEPAAPLDSPIDAATFRLEDDIDVYTFASAQDDEWLPGDFAQYAILVRATDIVGVGPVDVLVPERDNGIQSVFTCGRVPFEVSFNDSRPRPVISDPDWFRDADRRARMFAFLNRLVDGVGCHACPETLGLGSWLSAPGPQTAADGLSAAYWPMPTPELPSMRTVSAPAGAFSTASTAAPAAGRSGRESP